jgi:hypothetical protein
MSETDVTIALGRNTVYGFIESRKHTMVQNSSVRKRLQREQFYNAGLLCEETEEDLFFA